MQWWSATDIGKEGWHIDLREVCVLALKPGLTFDVQSAQLYCTALIYSCDCLDWLANFGIHSAICCLICKECKPNSGTSRDQLTTDQLTTDQLTTDQLTTDQLTTDQLTTDRLTTDRLTTDQLSRIS